MTSCGCFECIVAIIPEANGVMIVHRGHTGMTPIGMKFSTLAGTVGGGAQTRIYGIGVNFISSKKFLFGDGGSAGSSGCRNRSKKGSLRTSRGPLRRQDFRSS